MKKLSTFRFIQIFLFFPMIIVLGTYNMTEKEQLIFISLLTFYTAIYEIILLKKSRR